MLLCMVVKLVELVDRTEMRKTGCFGETRRVLQYLAHHELESVIIIIIITVRSLSRYYFIYNF